MRAVLLALALFAASGCSPSARQRILSANATVVVETQPERETFYERQHSLCIREIGMAEYTECMVPPRALATAVDTYDRLLRAAQAALDASNEAEFQNMIPDLVRAAVEVVRGLEAAGVPIPESVLQIAALAGGL